jgi:hypothetical protein
MGIRPFGAVALALVIYFYPSVAYYEAPLKSVVIPQSSGSLSLLQLRAGRSVNDVKDELARLQTEIAALTAEVTGNENTGRRPSTPDAWTNDIEWDPVKGDLLNETVPVLFPVTLPLLPFAALVDTLKRKHGHAPSYEYANLADNLSPKHPLIPKDHAAATPFDPTIP